MPREKGLSDFEGVTGGDLGGWFEERAEILGLDGLLFFSGWGVGRLLGKRGLTRGILLGEGGSERELQLLEELGGDRSPSLMEMWEGEPAGGLSTLLPPTLRRFLTGPTCFLLIYFPPTKHPQTPNNTSSKPHVSQTATCPYQASSTTHQPPNANTNQQKTNTTKTKNNFFSEYAK